MKTQALTHILPILTLSGIFAMSASVQALPSIGGSSASAKPTVSNAKTSFVCVPERSGNYATVAQRGDRQAPLIVWTVEGSQYFGDKYPPQTRCALVTQKLNMVLEKNGNTLKNVSLAKGEVVEEMVICAISSRDTGCNSNNMLFTLKKENSDRADEILKQISDFASKGSGAGYIEETSWGDVSVNLGEWENQAFDAADNINPPQMPEENLTPDEPISATEETIF
jgi:hypothetical protein